MPTIARLAALLALAIAPFVRAQAWPERSVKIIVPFAAGGPADIYARAIGERLSQSLGVAFVVEDRPGGGSIVGTDAAARSSPDGCTFLMMSNTHTVNESLIPSKPYALMKDFVPVAPVNYSDLLLVVHPSVPAATLRESLGLAKSRPGKLNFASSGPGTPCHMAGELFKTMAEAGVPGYEAVIGLGVVAPAGTPSPIVERMNAEIRRVTENADMRAAWAKQGATAMSMTTEEFGRFLREDIE